MPQAASPDIQPTDGSRWRNARPVVSVERCALHPDLRRQPERRRCRPVVAWTTGWQRRFESHHGRRATTARMSQRQGRSAERKFSLLCSHAGVTCHEPTDDDHGWDFHVEFKGPPVDRANGWPSLRSAFVQVKQTGAERPSVRLTVSAALDLMVRQEPSFLVLFHELHGRLTSST